MTRSSLSARPLIPYQVFSKLQFMIAIVLLLALSGLAGSLSAQQQALPPGPKIWLGDNQALPVHPAGPSTLAGNVAAGKAQPLSMTAADVDGDGVTDLIAGFSGSTGGSLVIHRGNVDAFAPQSTASFQAIGRGQFPSPFLPNAQVIDIPVRPDFVVAGNFTVNGHVDLIVAARGGNSLLVLSGDGKGNFTPQQTVNLTGNITALGAEKLTNGAFSNLLVGMATPQNASLLVFSGSPQGVVSVENFTLSGAASQIVFGDFGDRNPDAAFVVGGDVFVLHSTTMQIENLHLPVSASAIALGSFINDRHPYIQIAILTPDGSIHIAAHNEFDPHALSIDEMRTLRQAIRNGEPNDLIPQRSVAVNGWKVVESIPTAAHFTAGQLPQFFRTRISDHGSDDVMVINPTSGQLSVISHPDVAPDAPSFAPAQISTRPYSGSPNAALPMRTNIDGRPGVVAMHAGQFAPAVMMPLPDPTFTVNTTADGVNPGACAAATPGQCTLREAVIEANNAPGMDTIVVPAGTYTLTLAKVANDCTAQHGALYINDDVNIVGAGQEGIASSPTIIQAGTTQATGVDMVMAVNEDLGTANCPITDATASISNLTLKFGHNNGTHSIDGDGGCMEFDTGSSGNATLSLDHVTLDSCTTTNGNGGGIAIFNATNPGAGQPTITNSIIQNNSTVDATSGVAATGGGVWVAGQADMTMSNTQVLNNLATQVSDTNTVAGEGGGISITNQVPNSRATAIHSSTISGNHAGGNGGGIHDESNLTIDQLSVISGNSAGEANKTNGQDGGGLWISTSSNGCPAACTDTASLSKVTITGNTTTLNGGGLAIGNGTGAGDVTIAFSRLAGNTAPTGKNLTNNHTAVTATDNWWGTNTPTNTIVDSGATTTSSPFIKMTHTAAPSTIKINGIAILTADLSNNSNGTALTGNLDVLNGVPISFGNAIKGNLSGAGTALDANAQATATFTAGAVSGNGSADATVDQQTVTAPIVILEPLQIAKSFVPTAVAVNTASTLTFLVTNPNVIAVDGSFTDTLPANLVVAATPTVVNGCGGTVTATAGATSVSFSNASLPAGACTITVHVSSAIDSVYNNSVTINSTTAGTGPQSTSSASLTVINPPSITKQFGAATIPLNGTTSLTFTITNSNANLSLSGINFTDSLPAGLVVATPSGLSGSCTGTATATAGSSSVSLSGASLAPGTSCSVSVNVQGTIAGQKNNSVQASDTVAGPGNTSNASITVVSPPVIIKAFGAASIPLNGSTSLSFTIQNNNTTVALTGVAFSDTMPAGLVISTPNGLTGTCGAGTITATAGTNVISLSGGTIAANVSCTFSVNVTGIAAGQQNNTTSNVTSTEGGTGGTASTSVKVEAPPSIAKVFNPSTIALNAPTSLTFTITNPAANADPLTGVAFVDTLPTGLTVANATTTVCGGTLTTTAPTGISLSGATIAVNSQCQFSVTVTGAASGQYTNTTGSVTSTNGGTGNTASANLTVVIAPPVIIKAFGAASIPLNGSTSLSFTIQNKNTTVSLSGVAFSDTLPAGLVISTPNGLTGACGGGTITATQNTSVISLSGAALAGNASCTFSINVTGIAAGLQNNTTGNVTSTESGPGGTASASINVVAPPSIAKVFNPANIALNATTSLTFTITNPAANAVALNGVAFIDTLPTGLTVANATATVCGGTLTTTAPTGIAISGATIAANSQCQFSITVTGAAAGFYTNTTSTVTSTNGGTGNTASANLTVATPPTINKAFGAASILVNASTSLTFTITNPNATLALSGIAFTDALPAGLQVSTPNALASTCGGTTTAAAGSSSISLSGGTLAANASCSISVNVTGIVAGIDNNTTGPISSTQSGQGTTSNTATITIIGPPALTKAFGAASINLNATTTLTFTITNPNATLALTGVGFGDTLPAGLSIANPNGLTGSCGAGTITTGTASGFSVVNLSGGTIAAGGSCTFSVNVVGTAGGHKVNTTGAVTSANAGSGGAATATIDVEAPDLTITKTHNGTFHRGQTGAPYLITISNVGFGPTVGTVTVVDTLPVIGNPNNIVPTDLSGTGWTCTLATLTCSRADALASGSSYPVITMTVNIPQNITNNFTNTAAVSGGGDVNPSNNKASDPVSLGPPIVITPHSNSSTVKAGASATFVFDVEDDDSTLGMVAFGCSGLPVGTTCIFNPPATNQPLSTVTMTLTTSGNASNVVTGGLLNGPNPRLYAALAFPIFGLVALVFRGNKSSKTKLRLMFAFAGMIVLMALAGCGGAHQLTTPSGNFSITVTGATTTVQATTQVSLTVQ